MLFQCNMQTKVSTVHSELNVSWLRKHKKYTCLCIIIIVRNKYMHVSQMINPRTEWRGMYNLFCHAEWVHIDIQNQDAWNLKKKCNIYSCYTCTYYSCTIISIKMNTCTLSSLSFKKIVFKVDSINSHKTLFFLSFFQKISIPPDEQAAEVTDDSSNFN